MVYLLLLLSILKTKIYCFKYFIDQVYSLNQIVTIQYFLFNNHER